MDEDFHLENMIESINLTGQYQPAVLPDFDDFSLKAQILDNIVLSQDDSILSHSIHNDDINNALFGPNMDPLDTFSFMFDSTHIVNNDITKLISSPIQQIQSTIDDNMERMNLHDSHRDILSSSISFPAASSPTEPKEIDKSILAINFNPDQEFTNKNSSKSKKNSKNRKASSTVGPVDILSSYGLCQPCPSVNIQNDFSYQLQTLQFDALASSKIQIISQPRASFRPRTVNESKSASHYIRCETNSEHEYPTIYIPKAWALQAVKNIIEVTLVGKDGTPHPYTIDNKTCKTIFDDNTLIFRQNDVNTLYFCLTDDDFKNGFKSFKIEYIKSKQDHTITKDLIKTRELDQSMLRFKRFYLSEKNVFEPDETSTEYSCLMTEAYGDVSVEHMGPTYGPMMGNERVYTLLKGRILKDDITVFVKENTTGWCQQLPFTKNGNLVFFSMPGFPYSQNDSALVHITIYFKGEELYQSSYLYKNSLDEALAELHLNDSMGTVDDPPISDTFDAFEFFSATGACPMSTSSRKSSTARRPKRLNKK